MPILPLVVYREQNSKDQAAGRRLLNYFKPTTRLEKAFEVQQSYPFTLKLDMYARVPTPQRLLLLLPKQVQMPLLTPNAWVFSAMEKLGPESFSLKFTITERHLPKLSTSSNGKRGLS